MLSTLGLFFLFVDFGGFRTDQVLGGGSRPGGRDYPERVGQPLCQVLCFGGSIGYETVRI